MQSSPLISELSSGLLTLTLNRPQQRNAINAQLRDAFSAALDGAATDSEVKAIVVCGAGGAFCSGGDRESFEELHDQGAYRWVSQRLSQMIAGLEEIEKPTIAVLHGVATGAGLALALAADWRIGTASTRILYREGALGMIPTHGGCARLVKLVGLARAKEAVLGGDELAAPDALRLGLVSEIADGDGLQAARERASKMLRRAPLSYGAAKRVLQIAADTDVHSAMSAEGLAQGALLATSDHREGLLAARERREPLFTGR